MFRIACLIAIGISVPALSSGQIHSVAFHVFQHILHNLICHRFLLCLWFLHRNTEIPKKAFKAFRSPASNPDNVLLCVVDECMRRIWRKFNETPSRVFLPFAVSHNVQLALNEKKTRFHSYGSAGVDPELVAVMWPLSFRMTHRCQEDESYGLVPTVNCLCSL